MSSIHPIAENARGNPAVPNRRYVGGRHGFPCGFAGQWPPEANDSCARPVPCRENLVALWFW